MNFLQLKKRLRSLMPLGYRPPREFVNPTREWLAGLLIGSTLFILGGVYAGNIFLSSLEDVELGGSPAIENEHNFKPERVERALEIYTAKQKTFDALRAEHTAPVQPTPASVEDATTPADSVAE